MPEPLGRSEFLLKVGEAVDLQPHDVGDVLEELNSHLSDAAAGWRDAGYDFEDAERRAILGLGDPQALGQELGRARHERRQLLAAVGGGIWSAFTFGLFAYLTLWLVVGGLAILGGMLAWWVLNSIGGSSSGWFTGIVGSLGTVLIWIAWFAWLGWILPGRVARSAHRSIAGVKTAVAVVGCVVLCLVLWAYPAMDMDPVLAIGLPLGPFAFLLTAQRNPNRGPYLFPNSSLKLRAGLAVGIVLGTAVVGMLTVTPSNDHMWSADLSTIASDGSDDPVLSAVDSSFAFVGDQVTVSFTDEAQAALFAHQYPQIAVEFWPATVRDGLLLFGDAPVAVASAPVTQETTVSARAPIYRTPIEVTMITIAVSAEGRRVLLSGPGGPWKTPAWHGTLLDWWFGPR